MRQRYLPFAIISLLIAALACARANAPTSAPTAPASLPTGESTRELTHDGRDRSYLLYVPTSVNWQQPAPLVLVFHGGTGNGQSARFMSGFNEVADQNGFIVVYPNGSGRLQSDILLTWNGGTCCAYAQENNIDDVGFARAIVADLQSLAPIDPNRIYASGMSNGALLSQRLGCEASDLFAAIAPVAGTLNVSPCSPTQSIAVIAFHGTADQHIPYDGGFGPQSLVNVDFASVTDSIDFWVAFNQCAPQPQTDAFDNIEHQSWTGCNGGTAVELYTVIEGGHAWPGGRAGRQEADQPTQTISASELIWDFFVAHPKVNP